MVDERGSICPKQVSAIRRLWVYQIVSYTTAEPHLSPPIYHSTSGGTLHSLASTDRYTASLFRCTGPGRQTGRLSSLARHTHRFEQKAAKND